MPQQPTIPKNIVIHLGAPDSDAQNVTENFADYIKNVASSEIYPTWPEEAIKANVLAQISVALNRVYTQYYRNRGKNFDITSSPAFDQTYVYQRDIYDNVARIVDEYFDSYIRREGAVEPLFAQFCDGIEISCNGLTQWGSVDLANQGLNYVEILRKFYGDNIQIVQNVPVEDVTPYTPAVDLGLGDTGNNVELIQIRLNRISRNFPGIPKIPNVDGFFDESTQNAVTKFQEVFGLAADGIVGKATWNKINAIYTSVKELSQISSEGLTLNEIETAYPGALSTGMQGDAVFTLQYYLAYLSLFIPTLARIVADGDFGAATENAVIQYQKTYGLGQTGVVDEITWNSIENTYYDILRTIPYQYIPGIILPYPGRVLREGIEGDDVVALQEYLNYIGATYPQIPRVSVDGIFGRATANAVAAFKRQFGLGGNAERVNASTWASIINVYDDIYEGNIVNDEQFPGYGIGG